MERSACFNKSIKSFVTWLLTAYDGWEAIYCPLNTLKDAKIAETGFFSVRVIGVFRSRFSAFRDCSTPFAAQPLSAQLGRSPFGFGQPAL